MMEFIFVCPKRKKTFESADFKIIENQGVITNSFGNNRLDAKVKLNIQCPFCGEQHVYQASELSCPFEVQKNDEATQGKLMIENTDKVQLTKNVTGSG